MELATKWAAEYIALQRRRPSQSCHPINLSMDGRFGIWIQNRIRKQLMISTEKKSTFVDQLALGLDDGDYGPGVGDWMSNGRSEKI